MIFQALYHHFMILQFLIYQIFYTIFHKKLSILLLLTETLPDLKQFK